MDNPLTSYRSVEVSQEIEEHRLLDAVEYYARYERSLVGRACPVCDSFDCEEIEAYAGLIRVVNCLRCRLVYVPDVLPFGALSEYYENSKSATLLNEFYARRSLGKKNLVLKNRVNMILEVIQQICAAKEVREIKILEVGCGSGGLLSELLSSLSAIGISSELYGVEPNRRDAEIARSKGVVVDDRMLGGSSILQEDYFDLILCYELIEHLVHPSGAMLDMFQSLSSGGVVVLTTPNIEGLENIAVGYNGKRVLAHAICPPAHLQGFSRITIALLAHRVGFSIGSIEASGSFDVYAIDLYNKSDLMRSPVMDYLNVVCGSLGSSSGSNREVFAALQLLINSLNGSSTMNVTLYKR